LTSKTNVEHLQHKKGRGWRSTNMCTDKNF